MAVELATTLAWNRNLDKAIVLFREVLARAPDAVGARGGLAFALAWQGKLDEARGIFVAITNDDPKNVSGWTGLAFVERASLRTTESTAAYRRVLDLDPGNAEATTALEAIRWDRRGQARVLAGFSSNPGVPDRGEARVDFIYAVDPRVTMTGGYQRYAFGAISPLTGGGSRFDTRREDSLEVGIVYRPSYRTALAASLYTFVGEDLARGIVWVEGAFALTSRISLIGDLRPAFSAHDPSWLWAAAAGVAIALPLHQQVTTRVLVAADTVYEPRLTLLVNYDAVLSRRLTGRLAAAHSSTDDRFEFTSVSAGAIYLLKPSFGVSADATRRIGTAERSTLLVGVVVRP
jgi:hypothetical protein